MKYHHHPHRRFYPLIALVALLFIPFSSAQPLDHIKISKFPFQESFEMRSSGTRFYRLDLASTPKNIGLMISVLPETGSDSPQLFASHHEVFPQWIDDEDYSPIATSRNDIFLSNKDIKGNSNSLYIGLLCESSKCFGNIRTEWAYEIQRANGEKTIEIFSQEKIAVFEDQKMIDLKPGIPVEMMSLKESSFVYFKYYHAVRQNFQLNLTKFSGQFNLYMISIEPTEENIYLPNQTHYKWQILHVASQSVMKIASGDCIGCTYLIKIEAISSSKFSLEVNHGDRYYIYGGIQYKGQLKPQESTVFLLKKSTRFFEEHQLDIEMKGKELSFIGSEDPMINIENYVWKETLTELDAHRVISLFSQDSSRDSFSLLLENPKDKDVYYSFNMITRRLQLQKFFGENVGRLYDLNPFEKKGFIYDSIEGDRFETDVIFYAEEKNVEVIMEKDLSKGQRIKALYWRSSIEEDIREYEPDEHEVYLEAGAEPKIRSNSSHVIFEQKFSIQNGKGKYIIEIANPWKFQVKFRIFMRKSDVLQSEIVHYFNGDNIIGSDSPKFYTTGQPNPGNWYFWLYSCGAPLDLKIENGDLETGMVTIPKGNDYLYKEAIQAGPRYVWMSVNPKSMNDQGKFVLYSSVFDEKEFKNFDLKEENLGVKVTFQINEDKNEVTVEFKPIELEDPESYDKINYQIWLCPDILELSTESSRCYEKNSRCQDFSLTLQKSKEEPAKISFQNVGSGIYFVKIQATIIYKHRAIKDVEPYCTTYLKVERSILGKNFQIFIGINITIVIIAVIFYRKLKELNYKTE